MSLATGSRRTWVDLTPSPHPTVFLRQVGVICWRGGGADREQLCVAPQLALGAVGVDLSTIDALPSPAGPMRNWVFCFEPVRDVTWRLSTHKHARPSFSISAAVCGPVFYPQRMLTKRLVA